MKKNDENVIKYVQELFHLWFDLAANSAKGQPVRCVLIDPCLCAMCIKLQLVRAVKWIIGCPCTEMKTENINKIINNRNNLILLKILIWKNLTFSAMNLSTRARASPVKPGKALTERHVSLESQVLAKKSPHLVTTLSIRSCQAHKYTERTWRHH